MTIQARNHAEPNGAHPRAGMTKRKLVMKARVRRRRSLVLRKSRAVYNSEPQVPRINEAWWRERSADGVFLLNQSGAGTRRTTQAGRPG